MKTSLVLLCNIDCCFTTVCKGNRFLELSFSNLLKIIASSNFNITSELEIFYAANNWVSHNLEKRSKFLKELLLKIRLTLLSESALKVLSSYSKMLRILSSFHKEGFEIINSILDNQTLFYRNQENAHQHRYCNHEMFDFLLCGSWNRNV